MTTGINAFLTPADYEPMLSSYLREGRKQERWRFGNIDIRDNCLETRVGMESPFAEANGLENFHLAVFPAQEMLAELGIILIHAWAGLTRKTREVWMIESKSSYRQAIRSYDDIRARLVITRARKRKDTVYVDMDFLLSDDEGGCFEGYIRSLMP